MAISTSGWPFIREVREVEVRRSQPGDQWVVSRRAISVGFPVLLISIKTLSELPQQTGLQELKVVN
jgi:hypothetical protein